MLPADGVLVVRKRVFPGPETRRMDPLAACPSLDRLAMVAELVVQDVEEEAAGDPRSGQARADLDARRCSASIAAEAEEAQAAVRRMPRPADLLDRRQGVEPGAADEFSQDMQVGLRADCFEAGEKCMIPVHCRAGPPAQDRPKILA